MIGSDQATRPGRPRRCPSLRRAVARPHVLNRTRRVSATATDATCSSGYPACTWWASPVSTLVTAVRGWWWRSGHRRACRGAPAAVSSPAATAGESSSSWTRPASAGRWGCGGASGLGPARTPHARSGTFTEQNPQVAPARALLTTRASRWAMDSCAANTPACRGWLAGSARPGGPCVAPS